MNEREIFMNAPAGATPEALAAYLDEVCGGDAELRARVEALIAADQDARSGPFGEDSLESHPTELHDSSTPVERRGASSVAERSGDVIGNYKVLHKIGEGGFGVVYMAEQLKPVRRRVALKIIKMGMDTKQVVARFEAERQALALMDHPNIAKVHDAGATLAGRPFFVMELVKGVPITQFCDDGKLETRERLELFIDVCHAVQHAHQKGVIHRDLKPSNVMVTIHDDRPVVKVIDFGVAKATQSELTDKTLFTLFEQFIGTPAYMSPEQAQVSGLDIDTRSDIYSLGVLLYELLTGQTPFDPKQLTQAGYDEIRRVIREDDPPKPSTRLSSLGDEELTAVAKRRRAEAKKLPLLLDGDLDWIVMKALEKERTRRYETASSFAQDIRAHLSSEPVSAAAPSALYTLRKFSRRNRVPLTVSALMLASLLVGLVVASWQAFRATRAEKINAVLLAQEQELRAEAEAQGREARAQKEIAEEQALQSRYNLAKVFEERSGFAVNRARDGREYSERDLRQAWLYSLSALGEEIGPGRRLPGAEVQLLMDELRGTTYRELWRTPTSFGTAESLCFSGDGQRFASASGGVIQLWSAGTGEEIARFRGSCVALNEDGTRLLAGAGEIVRLWDVAADEEVAAFAGHGDLVNCVAFTRSGRHALSGSDDRTLRRWDLVTGRESGRFEAERAIEDLALNPEGTEVLFSSGGDLLVCELSNLDEIARFTGHTGTVMSVAFSPDGGKVVSASPWEERLHLWERGTGRELRVAAPDEVRGGFTQVVFCSGGSQIAAGDWQGAVHLWDASSGDHVGRLDGHRSSIWGLAAGPGETGVLSGSRDGAIRLWDISQRKTVAMFSGQAGSVQSVDFSPDGRHVLAGSFDSSRLWDTVSRKEVAILPGVGGIANFGDRLAVFTSDGRRIIHGSQDAALRIWDIRSQEETARFPAQGDRIVGVACSPDDTMAASLSVDGALWVFDLVGNQVLLKRSGFDTAACSFSPDGSRILVGGDVFDLAAQSVVRRFAHRGGRVASSAFGPQGTKVVTGSTDGTVALWDVESEEEIARFTGHRESVTSVAFSPDGLMLLSGSEDNSLRLWSVRTGKVIAILSGHGGEVRSVAFSPDGRRVISGSEDASVRLWDIDPGFHAQVTDPGLEFWQIAMNRDLSRVLAGSHASLCLWDLNEDKEILRISESHPNLWGVAFTKDESHLVSGNREHVALWDVRTGEKIHGFSAVQDESEGWTLEGFFSPGGSLAAFQFHRGQGPSSRVELHVWDVAGREKIAELKHPSLVDCAAFDPEGRRVASVDDLGVLRLWDVYRGAVLSQVRMPGPMEDLAFSPDGARALMGSREGTLFLVDLGSMEVVARMEGHGSYVTEVELSPDGRFALSASGDRTLRLWDLSTEQEIRRIPSGDDPVRFLGFSPDSSRIVIPSKDGRLVSWDVGYLSIPMDRDFGRIVEASLRMYPFRLDGFRLVESPDLRHFSPLDGFRFANPRSGENTRAHILRSQRPAGRDLVSWLLDPDPDPPSGREYAQSVATRTLEIGNFQSAISLLDQLPAGPAKADLQSALARSLLASAQAAGGMPELSALSRWRLVQLDRVQEAGGGGALDPRFELQLSEERERCAKDVLAGLQQSPALNQSWWDAAELLRAAAHTARSDGEAENASRLAQLSALAWLKLSGDGNLVAAARAGVLETLVPSDAVWAYRDLQEPPPQGWREPEFDDAGWKRGPAVLGYGFGSSNATSLSEDAATACFRTTFTIENPSRFSSLTAHLSCIDGVIVYLNGREIVRDNMPASEIDHQSAASERSRGFHGAWGLAPENLVAGVNTLAAEVHRAEGNDQEMEFSFSLHGSNAADLHGQLQALSTVDAVAVWGAEVALPSPLRVELLRHSGHPGEALRVIEEELGGEVPPGALVYYHGARAETLELLERYPEAARAYEEVLEALGEPEDSRVTKRYQAARDRCRQAAQVER